jgi:pyruvate dehydrogenase E2 component (dihydrolipoamide acetyltransferase)
MSRIKQFKLPDLGEGLTEGEILKWLVSPGETIVLNQPIVEVETAKAAVEIPSPYAGVVTEIFHGEGETVDVGSPIISVDTEPGSPEPMEAAGNPLTAGLSEPSAPAVEFGAPTPRGEGGSSGGASMAGEVSVSGETPGASSKAAGAAGRTPVLVGYGPRNVTASRRPRRSSGDGGPGGQGVFSAAGVTAVAGGAADAPLVEPDLPLLPTIPDQLHSAAKPVRHGGLELGRAVEQAALREQSRASGPVLAKPPVRKLAKDLGLDLATVRGTGVNGTITREDVHQAAASGAGLAVRVGSGFSISAGLSAGSAGAASTSGLPAGREERRPIKGVRKLTAQAMVSSAFTAPHVTEFITVDMTRTMKLVAKLKESREFSGVRVGPLLLLARALLAAVKRNPDINSSWDAAAEEIVVKHYVNLGIAAATPRGLMVPNIKDAHALSLLELATAMNSLVAVAKEGKTAPAELSGGTITITNVGVFGVDNGTPILNPGEAAILCFGAVREQPWIHKGKVKPRLVTQLSLSFDHRMVDGELGSKFLADVAAVLADPSKLIAWS